MKQQPLLIGVAWAASLIAAYFMGNSGPSAHSTSTTGGAKADGKPTAAETADGGGRVARRQMDDLEELPAGAKADVKTLIARARLQFGSGMNGMMNMRSIFRAIAPIAELDDSQIQEALAEVEGTVREPQQKMMFYSLLLGQWAETDGKAALAYAEEKLGQQSPFDMGVRASILGSWARRDPDAVWRWYQTERKDDGNDRNKSMLTSMIFAGMAQNDLDSALQRVGTLDEQSRAMALSGIANSAGSETARERLLNRALSMPKEQQAQIRQGVVGQWAMNDSDGALKWIRSLSAEDQKPLRESAGSMLLMMKPAVAADFMLEGAEDKDRSRLYDRVAGQWAHQDVRAAGEWLMKQSQGEELDAARRTYASVVAQKDPSAAMDWAKSVQKPEDRSQAVEQIYQQWRMKDASAAVAALESSGLPPGRIKSLKEMPLPEKAKTSNAVRFGF